MLLNYVVGFFIIECDAVHPVFEFIAACSKRHYFHYSSTRTNRINLLAPTAFQASYKSPKQYKYIGVRLRVRVGLLDLEEIKSLI